MKFLEAYTVNDADFIGGYCKPDHEYVWESVNEIYYEKMLFKSVNDENDFMIVSNYWNFYGAYCRVVRLITHTSKQLAMQWYEDHVWYDNWTENLAEIIYDVKTPENNVHFTLEVIK